MAVYQNLNNYFAQDASRIVGMVDRISRARGVISPLMKKGELPEGMGYNYSKLLQKRSVSVGSNDWQIISQEDGTTNNCMSPPNTITGAATLLSWNAYYRMLQSNPYCFEDLRRAYNPREQISGYQMNFAEEIQNLWENKDNERWFYYSGHKIIANSSLTENANSPVMPLTPPSTRGIQGILDILWERIMVDGGYEEDWPKVNGGPLIPAIMSQQQNRNILKEDASTRQDINYAMMGKGEASWLFQNWGLDRAYSGYVHKTNLLQPRYDWINSAWVQRDYYTSVATTIGSEAVVNPAFTNAAYEDIYLWHPKVVTRNMPKPMSSMGAKTAFNPVKWNGDVMWLNVQNLDTSSAVYNPVGNVGVWFSALQAGWEPDRTQYGYALRVQRCSKFTASACYA